ncbi:MAG: phage baseplate protein [Nannocystaceae bacterium]
MSLGRFGPQQRGVVIPLDPVTGAPLGRPWSGDYVAECGADYPTTVATHPVQQGTVGPTDAILRGNKTVNAVIVLNNSLTVSGRIGHLRPDFAGPNRAEAMLSEIEAIRDKGVRVNVLLPGMGLRRGYAISALTPQWDRTSNRCNLTISFTETRVVSLVTDTIEQSGDLIALGSQTVTFGTS